MDRNRMITPRSFPILLTATVLAAGCSDGAVGAGPGGGGSDGATGQSDGQLGDASDAGPTTEDAGSPLPQDTGVTPPLDTAVHPIDGGAPDSGPTLPGELVALTLSPPLATLPIGASLPFELVGKFDDGSSMSLADVAKWTSSEPVVASISPLGVALANSAGETTIEAAISGQVAKATITVTPLKITKLTVDPTSATVSVGATVGFSALVTLQDGSTDNVSNAVSWSSDELNVATVDGKGVATGVAAGKTTIRAKLGDLEASATLDVSGAKLTGLSLSPVDPVLTIGATVAFAAEASFDDGSVAEVTKAATWSSSAPTIVSVNSGGVATALAAGTAIIEAKHGGLSATRIVTVQKTQLASLAITPAKATVAAGAKQAFKLQGTYSDGSKGDLTASGVWTTEPAGIAVVSNAPGSQGQATGLIAGTAKVRASFGGKSAEAELVVSAATLKSIAITPADPKVPKGIKLKVRAHGTYSDGKVLEVTGKVVWSSGDSAVATVSNAADSAGWLKGIKEGKTTITAQLDGIKGSTSVTVSAAALVKITVKPATFDLPVGLKQAFTASGQYSDGAVVDVTSTAVWSSTDAKVAAVSNAKGGQGIVAGLSAGKVQIKATVSGLVGVAQVTVKAPELIELTIGPNNLTRKAGQKVQYYAMAVYSNSKSQNVTGQAQWSSSNTSVANILKSGNFIGVASALKPGKTTITAKFKGKTASTQLTVVNPELLSVQVTPAAWTMAVGMPMQFQAVALFSDDSSQNVTFQSDWTSTNYKIAQVGNKMGGFGGGNKGRVMALQPGNTKIKAAWKGMVGSASVTVTPAQVTGLSLFPGEQTMAVGQFRGFQATLLYSDGTAVQANWQATWTSSNSKVAAALNGQGQKGYVQGLAPGTATITASAQGFKATAKVVVTAAEAKELQIMPGVATVAKGVPVKFNVVAVFTDDTTQYVGGQATFTSSDKKVAVAFNGGQMGGLVQTLAPGKVTIKCSWKGLSTSAELTVKPAELKELQITPTNPTVAPGSWVKFNAVAVYTDDTTQQMSNLASWKSSHPSVASVSNMMQGMGKGLTQALKPGTSTISATWNGKTGSTKLTVPTAALIEIQVTPFSPILPLGYLTMFKATGVFSDYTVQDLTWLASWTSSDTKVATIATVGMAKGLVTPLSAGKATITAAFQGTKGSTVLSVTAAKLKSIAITPASAKLKVQQQVPLQAAGTFDDGTKLNLTPFVLWKSDKPPVVSVSNAQGSKGVAKGLGKGAAKVSAIRDGVTGVASVVVE